MYICIYSSEALMNTVHEAKRVCVECLWVYWSTPIAILIKLKQKLFHNSFRCMINYMSTTLFWCQEAFTVTTSQCYLLENFALFFLKWWTFRMYCGYWSVLKNDLSNAFYGRWVKIGVFCVIPILLLHSWVDGDTKAPLALKVSIRTLGPFHTQSWWFGLPLQFSFSPRESCLTVINTYLPFLKKIRIYSSDLPKLTEVLLDHKIYLWIVFSVCSFAV